MGAQRPVYRPQEIERGSQISPINVHEPKPRPAPPPPPPVKKK